MMRIDAGMLPSSSAREKMVFGQFWERSDASTSRYAPGDVFLPGSTWLTVGGEVLGGGSSSRVRGWEVVKIENF